MWSNLEHGVTWNAAHSSAPYSKTGIVRLTSWDGIGRFTSAPSYRGLQVLEGTLVHFFTMGCKSLTLSFAHCTKMLVVLTTEWLPWLQTN